MAWKIRIIDEAQKEHHYQVPKGMGNHWETNRETI